MSWKRRKSKRQKATNNKLLDSFSVAGEKQKSENLVFKAGVLLIGGGALLFLLIFSSVIRNEARYFFSKKPVDVRIALDEKESHLESAGNEVVVVADENFSLIIPKIDINTKVIENVDPFNEAEYRSKLREGVAHAKGSGLPQDDKTMFVFAHSSDSFLRSDENNSIFYLLRKLEKGDKFYVVHKGEVFDYEVTKTGSAGADAMDHLEDSDEHDVVLMTCWPPGTDLQRFLVFAEKL